MMMAELPLGLSVVIIDYQPIFMMMVELPLGLSMILGRKVALLGTPCEKESTSGRSA